MSTPDPVSVEGARTLRSSTHQAGSGPGVHVLRSRSVPLGGPRAMRVSRTIPQRERTSVGAWCLADHYGPQDVSTIGGMDVPPHPHFGLQTVSWLFSGEIEHRDTGGVHAMVRPGELNLMTAGHGIAHSEVSTAATTVLHGVQLWLALPAAAAGIGRGFAHHVPPVVARDGVTARVFLGELLGSASPVPTHTPLLGAELVLDAGATVELDLRADFEHGVLVDTGELEIVTAAGPVTARRTEMAHLGVGTSRITLRSAHAAGPARLIVLGGAPLGEDLVMWWNFVGRSHEEIVAARADWSARSERFGQVRGYRGAVQHLPAPALPGVRLRPRR